MEKRNKIEIIRHEMRVIYEDYCKKVNKEFLCSFEYWVLVNFVVIEGNPIELITESNEEIKKLERILSSKRGELLALSDAFNEASTRIKSVAKPYSEYDED